MSGYICCTGWYIHLTGIQKQSDQRTTVGPAYAQGPHVSSQAQRRVKQGAVQDLLVGNGAQGRCSAYGLPVAAGKPLLQKVKGFAVLRGQTVQCVPMVDLVEGHGVYLASGIQHQDHQGRRGAQAFVESAVPVSKKRKARE
jgi:hypothetical protein